MAELVHTRGVAKLPRVSSRRWRGPAVTAFGVAFAVTLLVGLLQGTRTFYGDSGQYWTLGDSFTHFGHFSLLNFEDPVRGYGLPLVLYGLKTVDEGVHWSSSSVVTIFNALVFVLIGTILAPRFAEAAWPQRRWGFGRRVALTALLLVFWSGNLNYPLTDFPGLAMALLALVAIAQPDSPGWMLTAGVAGGIAINLRPAYLLFVPMFAVIIAWTWFEQRAAPHASLARRALCACLLVAGFAIASLPQSLSAHRYHGTWSFIPGASINLEEEKLTAGLSSQRYDTYEGPRGPSAIVYGDATGQRLLEQQPEGKINGLSQYVGLIASHPTVMVPLFTRHIVNGLDARYSTIYVEHYDSGGRTWLRLAGFLLVFLALARVLWPSARRALGPARWRYPFALLLCSLTSVATEIETRYMLPVYLLCYILALAPGWPNPLGPAEDGLRRFRTPAVLAVACLAFMAIVWHMVSAVHGHVVFG
jgi:hypothetical protein